MNRAKEIKDVLLGLNDLPVFLAGHTNPDQDSICSCLALAEFLNNHGKKAYALLDDADKDIIAWQNDYSIVSNDVECKDFNFIALDMNEKKRLGKFEQYFDRAKYSINIDHHQNNQNEADFVYSLPGVSSTCEMVYNIIVSAGKNELTKTICERLYAGIFNDTNGLTRRLSSQTLSIVQELINFGIDYMYINKKTFSERSFYEFKALAKLVNKIEYDYFHYVVVDRADEDFSMLTHNQLVKKIAEELRKIEGFDVFVLLIKNGQKIIAKVMSNVSENADKIASMFGGGGHKREAGFTIENISVEEIIQKTKQYLINNSAK